MGSLADVAPKDYIGIVRDWTVGAWKKVWDDGIVNELVPGVKQFNTCRDVEVKGEDKSLTLGLPLKTGLEYQWADGQSGNARGLTFVQYVFTPHSAATVPLLGPPPDIYPNTQRPTAAIPSRP